jgi:hypothetical protein
MAEHGAFAGEQDRSEVSAFPTEATMTDGIDASVDREEAPRPDPLADLVSCEAERDQLHSTNNAMLPGGERRDCPIQRARSTFGREERPNVDLGGHAARIGGRGLRRCLVCD